MIRYLIRRYQVWRYARSQRHKVFITGSLLNILYSSRIVFIHIPKTAGISLIKAIYNDINLPGHRSFFFYNTALNMKNEKYFCFSFVRNPFDRLYSAYMFLKKGGINHIDRLIYETYLLKFNDFEDFVLNGLDNKLIFKITHFIPQHEFLCDRRGNIMVDFIGRFENLEDDVKSLSIKLKKDIRLNHYNSNYKKDYKEVYTAKMVSKVKTIYYKDLKIFNYKFN